MFAYDWNHRTPKGRLLIDDVTYALDGNEPGRE
jgi:hypothetical protein